jgi:salicylate hydroxylase
VPRPIVVAGAGVAGLSTALALARAGREVVVFERAAELEALGAGLQLAPNATRILRGWGVLDRLAPVAGRPDALVVRSARSGRTLARMPLGEAAELRWGAPNLTVHRGDLQAALVAALADEPRARLRLGAAVEGFDTSSEGVVARLADGAEMPAEALIGADGLRSAIRAALLGDGPPLPAAKRALRALVPAAVAEPGLAADTGLWLGATAHLVHYPVRGGRELNLVLVTGLRAGAPAEIASAWANPARALVAAAPAWTDWPIERRRAVPELPAGRVSLVGDAWPPSTPHLAQGAALAIEDAAALAQALQHESDAASAFATYAAGRLARVRRVVRASAFNGFAFGLPWPASLARDLAVATLGGEGLARRYDWLFGEARP